MREKEGEREGTRGEKKQSEGERTSTWWEIEALGERVSKGEKD